jgi:GT2 family glycosyltransferase
MSKIDVIIVLHNSKSLIPSLMGSLESIAVPITAYFLDNASSDGTPEILAEAIQKTKFPAFLMRSLLNNGFARGVNFLARQGTGDFLFLLNPDTELEPDCLEKLLQRSEADPRIAICEAKQSPREHPKTFDSTTGETTWCSGAAVLIRRAAFEELGGFDEHLYFMYCEDVDLSWKLWIRGWKCVYNRDAVVRHYTQDLVPGKRRTMENYFSFRNSIFLFYRFGSWRDREILRNFLVKRFVSQAYSFQSKILFMFALIDHIRYIPYLVQTRDSWGDSKHPWVRLTETSLSH